MCLPYKVHNRRDEVVDLGRIELPFMHCKCIVLPLNYSTISLILALFCLVFQILLYFFGDGVVNPFKLGFVGFKSVARKPSRLQLNPVNGTTQMPVAPIR